ncbi:hypothetical protein ACKN8S_08015 [Limosilactobacillus reuteri]|uniref:hypothetical protein n=1 Tax=Limosilactobacillus reuteri TaxID=1598 RepID=UPI0039BF81C2
MLFIFFSLIWSLFYSVGYSLKYYFDFDQLKGALYGYVALFISCIIYAFWNLFPVKEKFFFLIKSIISAPIIITDSSMNFVKLNSSYIVVLGSFMLVTLIFLIVNFVLVSKIKE